MSSLSFFLKKKKKFLYSFFFFFLSSSFLFFFFFWKKRETVVVSKCINCSKLEPLGEYLKIKMFCGIVEVFLMAQMMVTMVNVKVG